MEYAFIFLFIVFVLLIFLGSNSIGKRMYEVMKPRVERKIDEELKNKRDLLNSIENEIQQKSEFNSTLLEIREEELNKIIDEKKKLQQAQLEDEIEEWAKSAQEAANFNAEQSQLIIRKLQSTIDTLTADLNDYRAKRDAINQEILRARAIEEKRDFYCIQLDEHSLSDIQLLNNIRKDLFKTDLLDKLIYDNYISKPTNEMIKRVLNNESLCGIYKITRLKTGEIYIGKSSDIKNRWQQHAKSAFHCGTISHSMLHTTMERDGINNFTWEVIEETTKDKLSEREKYWINFYDSKKYGLNEREGG